MDRLVALGQVAEYLNVCPKTVPSSCDSRGDPARSFRRGAQQEVLPSEFRSPYNSQCDALRR